MTRDLLVGLHGVLKDVGIAMGQGTAVAKEVADIALSDGGLSSIVKLVKLSRTLVNPSKEDTPVCLAGRHARSC